jgi:3-isopropylmalate dehydrogenase
MKTHKIAIIPGDGIGPEVVEIGLNVLTAVSKAHDFHLETKCYSLGADHYLETGEALSDETLNSLTEYDAIFLGAVGSPDVKPGILEQGILLKLRFRLDQYINLRPVKLYPGIETPLKGKTAADLDYIVVRENTGGLYTGVGGICMKGTADEVAVQSMVYNYKQVERCLRYAFELAGSRPRRTLALIGKSNVLTHVFGLWDRVFHELGEGDFPEVNREYYHVDAACMHMVNEPGRFDVMVTTNMFGDIITDLGAITQGGMGMAASGNINPTRKYPSMFEPVHGSAPDIAGQDKANPIAAVITVKMMLNFLGESKAAEQVDRAIAAVTSDGIEGVGTREIGDKFRRILE